MNIVSLNEQGIECQIIKNSTTELVYRLRTSCKKIGRLKKKIKYQLFRSKECLDGHYTRSLQDCG